MAQQDNRRRRADGTYAPKSTVLTRAEEAIVVAYRDETLLPLDDVLGYLRETISNFSRSGLHRCLQRHRAHQQHVDGITEQRRQFKIYKID